MSSGDADAGSGTGTRWEGFSNYEKVSQRISESVDNAIDSYALLQSRHAEGAAVRPDLASEARSHILASAMRLSVEMESDRDEVDVYDEILTRWREGGEDTEDGMLAAFQEAKLQEGVPGWLYNFVEDIRRAAWELGYLQAGRQSRAEPDDPVEAESEAMFNDL